MKRERNGRVIAVVGMQWGSEGKGAITSYLAPLVSAGIRTGSANAGHTVYFHNKSYVMRQMPSVWINPTAALIIGPSAIINLDILLNELETIEAVIPVKERFYIHPKVHVVTEGHIQKELQTHLGIRIGSTSARSSEGIGAARAAKVMREQSCMVAAEIAELKPYLADTVDLANSFLEQDEFCLLEGTQGFGLSLDHGAFPYVTSIDTSAGALASSAGIALHEFPVDIIGVLRTYPIRVAGHSGPFGSDSEEITWQELARRCGANEGLTEYTSVTKLERRVATFSESEFQKACQINRPTELALTFCDYLDWAIHEKEELSSRVEDFVDKIENLSMASTTLAKTGPMMILDLDPYRRSILRRIQTT